MQHTYEPHSSLLPLGLVLRIVLCVESERAARNDHEIAAEACGHDGNPRGEFVAVIPNEEVHIGGQTKALCIRVDYGFAQIR